MSDPFLAFALAMPPWIQEKMILLGNWLLRKWPVLRRLA